MKIGSTTIADCKIGSNQVNKIYIGSTQIWQKAAAYDADYQAKLDRATALGYTLPSDTVKVLENAFYVGLKADGVYSKLQEFWIHATDGSNNYAAMRGITPLSAAATLHNTPTFTTNQGFTGNGTSSWIEYMTVDGSGNFKLNSASFGSVIRTFGATAVGAATLNGDGIPLWFRFQDSRLYVNSNGFISGVSTPANKSLVVGNRSSSGLQEYYLNGSFVANDTDVSSAIPTASLRALRQGATYSNSQIAFSFIGASLNSTEQAALDSRLDTYFAGLTGW